MITNNLYAIEIRDRNGVKLGEFENARDISFTRRLNNYGTCSFTVSANDAKLKELTALRRYEVYVRKGTQYVWGGEMATRMGTLNNALENRVRIIAFEFLEALAHRYTSPSRVFDQVDAGLIAWGLIDDTQNQTNGDIGITQGLIQPTKLRDRKYSNHNIYERIIALTEVIAGFDCEITPDKKFNVYTQKGRDLTSIALEWGKNIETVEIVENFTTPGNRAIVLGEGFDQAQLRVDRQDAGAQIAHGVREYLSNEMLVSEIATLQDKGDAIIRKYKQPELSISIFQLGNTEPALSSATVGDRVRVRIKEGVYAIDNMMRIYRMAIGVDNQTGAEDINFEVGVL